ncbi:twin-arginine translocation signal domain-containing protein [Streptomyces sp. NBC_00388]|uniref:twin-arginine translocation signal domain-containing protein n=1 Tax=Streptomyces sp. NBC_00388 TaxID=2975735 RepID=UPI002E20793B
MLGTGTTRRSVLGATAAAGAALLTGCSERSAAHRTQGSAAAGAADALRRRSARTSGALLALYDAVLARHGDPATEKLAGPLRAAVALHVEALTPPAQDPGSGAPGGPPGAKRSPAPAPPGVPADRKAALRALAAAERRTADAHTAALAGAPPELARLLASVAAASAVHAYLLTPGDH